ncbi:MAG: hypothetical protein WCH05_06540 [Chlorobiaceae bacterium]
MKHPAEWNNEQNLFNDVYQALEGAGLDVNGTEEEGSYDEQGCIEIRAEDGRRFRLELTEISF